eukprot:gene18481-37423_t
MTFLSSMEAIEQKRKLVVNVNQGARLAPGVGGSTGCQ